MTWSTNFSTRSALGCLSLLLWLGSCAGNPPRAVDPIGQDTPVIAVMPINNLSGFPAPLEGLRQRLLLLLEGYGVQLLPESQLQAFMAEQRIRYLGGIDAATARQMENQTAVDAVLFSSLELLNDTAPPRIAVSARLVSPGADILWMQGVAVSGDEDVGLLELNRVENADILIDQALERLIGSLADHFRQTGSVHLRSERRAFEPEILFRASLAEKRHPYRVAVLPFLNLSRRKHAGTLMQLHFTKNIHTAPELEAVEPGIIRQALLQSRTVMVDGISLADADALFEKLQADLILSGRVFDYQDFQGEAGETRVCFSAMLLEKENRRMAWSAQSCRTGDVGVWFFDRGKIRTAHVLADAMARGAVESIAP